MHRNGKGGSGAVPGQITPREIICKSAINKTGIPGYDYCLNPYVGCAHACVYCYASFMCRFTGHREKWGEFVDIKVNLPGALERQLSRRCKPSGTLILGTVTDAYQPLEAQCRITRDSLEILAAYQRLQVTILTKSALVERDLDLLRKLWGCEVGFSLTTIDPEAARVLEPWASAPQRRLEAARRLVEAGIAVWVFIAPLLPGISDTDENFGALLMAITEAGVREILVDPLNPYPAVVHRLKETYQRHFPQALPALEAYLAHQPAYVDNIKARIKHIGARTGCRPSFV